MYKKNINALNCYKSQAYSVDLASITTIQRSERSEIFPDGIFETWYSPYPQEHLPLQSIYHKRDEANG